MSVKRKLEAEPEQLRTVFRISRYCQVSTENVSKENLATLRRLLTAQVLQLERENFPGSWTWRHPK